MALAHLKVDKMKHIDASERPIYILLHITHIVLHWENLEVDVALSDTRRPVEDDRIQRASPRWDTGHSWQSPQGTDMAQVISQLSY